SRPVPSVTLAAVASPPQPGAGLPYSEFSQRMESMGLLEAEPVSSVPAAVPRFTLVRPASPTPRFEFTESVVAAAAANPVTYTRATVPDTHGPIFPGGWMPEPENLEALRDLRPLGQIHDSFIIAAGRDGLWIIDQHVAHERI